MMSAAEMSVSSIAACITAGSARICCQPVCHHEPIPLAAHFLAGRWALRAADEERMKGRQRKQRAAERKSTVGL